MSERFEDRAADPLPRDWLPSPQPPEESPEWEAKVERIMAAVDSEAYELEERPGSVSSAGWRAFGRWWKPAAALAAAVVSLFIAMERPGASPDPTPSALPLDLMVRAGDPVAAWEASLEAFGIQADPVLAIIAFQGQLDLRAQATHGITPEEED
jgi:hypothetical protein